MPGIEDSKTILIIGATSGIGRALALAIHKLPAKPTVVVAGRRKERLDEMVKQASSTGQGKMDAVQVDVNTGREALKTFVDNIIATYPDLDTVIISSGIQNQMNFTRPEEIDLDEAISELNTNYTAVLTLATLFMPHLLKIGAQGRPAFIAPISSQLAIFPVAFTPNYCATKAALHSLCISLHVQLQGTNVHVMEILPPLVESELHDKQGTSERLAQVWMPLDAFTEVTMEGLKRGDFQVMTDRVRRNWEKYEKGKVELCVSMYPKVL